MLKKLVIGENCCVFIVLNYKELQTIIAMITESEVIELFCMADDNFIVNLLSAIAAYCCFPKKPCINVARKIDTQLALF